MDGLDRDCRGAVHGIADGALALDALAGPVSVRVFSSLEGDYRRVEICIPMVGANSWMDRIRAIVRSDTSGNRRSPGSASVPGSRVVDVCVGAHRMADSLGILSGTDIRDEYTTPANPDPKTLVGMDGIPRLVVADSFGVG